MAGTLSVEGLHEVARAAGLDEIGIAGAEPFTETRAVIEARKAAGLHGGMHFTYGRPERSTDPEGALPGARSLIVAALSYRRRPPPDPGPNQARVAAYQWDDGYERLRAGLGAVAAAVEASGWRAEVLADDNRLVDRAAAHRAGLGWFGRNTNLLLPGRGSWFLLGSVLTDAPLEPAAAPEPDGCGSCRRCLPACPTGALGDGVLDARRCLAWLLQATGSFPREHRVALGDRLYGCDDCQTVCPPNRREAARPGPAAAEPGRAVVDVVELLAADDAALMQRYGHWYVPRRRPEYLRRNALVVLGNVGVGTDPRVAAALRTHLSHDEPMVVAHAVWAARRLGREDLVSAAHHLDHPEVRAELDAPVPRRG